MLEWLRQQAVDFCIARIDNKFWYYVFFFVATDKDIEMLNAACRYIQLRRNWIAAQKQGALE